MCVCAYNEIYTCILWSKKNKNLKNKIRTATPHNPTAKVWLPLWMANLWSPIKINEMQRLNGYFRHSAWMYRWCFSHLHPTCFLSLSVLTSLICLLIFKIKWKREQKKNWPFCAINIWFSHLQITWWKSIMQLLVSASFFTFSTKCRQNARKITAHIV